MRSSRPDARKWRGKKTLRMIEIIIVTIARSYATTPGPVGPRGRRSAFLAVRMFCQDVDPTT